MHECPKCKSPRVHPSRSRSQWERLRKEITGKRPFRCSACRWRGWGVDSGPTFTAQELAIASGALAPAPPNLTGAGFGRDERRRATLDLARLDVLVTAAAARNDASDPE
jgi:hypothetical protein